MVEYNIVKYCRMCKKRMVLPKKESKKIYCNPCQKKVNVYYKEEQK